jgi:hypothetical protein
MPQKTHGNLDTIGKSWNTAHDFIRNHLKADYLSVVDVDTSLPPNYYQYITQYMNAHPQVGVSSGLIRGQENKNLVVPMGLGKVVRWEILHSFSRYWDLAPDSFLNIKAVALGYDLRILPIFLNSAPMTIFSRKGRFRYGRRQYYVRKHPLMVLFESIRLQLTDGQGSEILRGYWVEWSRGSWKCQDTDIRFYYSLKRALCGVIGLKSSGWRKKRVIDASKNQN